MSIQRTLNYAMLPLSSKRLQKRDSRIHLLARRRLSTATALLIGGLPTWHLNLAPPAKQVRAFSLFFSLSLSLLDYIYIPFSNYYYVSSHSRTICLKAEEDITNHHPCLGHMQWKTSLRSLYRSRLLLILISTHMDTYRKRKNQQ